MLGMVNTPTDGVDFYASPSSTNLKAKDTNKDIKVFTEAKERRRISYTGDGRKLVDGKLEESEALTDPLKTWNRLIINRIAASSIPKTEDLNRKPSKTRKLLNRLSGKAAAEAKTMPVIEIAEPVTVTSGNPRLASEL